MKDNENKKTELFEARVELFFKALMLHKAAILANRYKFRTNFYNFSNLKMLNKSVYDTEVCAEIFRSLFFDVPVVSSTFAAFWRCFGDFGCESIGYLLIDEAGQAALSNAVCALWRAHHALVVGDLLQLEPVVTLPEHLNKILLDAFGVDDELNLAQTSVQIRADKVEKYGTYIGDSENKIWVGSPLRVHNRYDNPMFEIANEIAYDGLMIWGRDKNKGDNKNLKSVWIDVKSTNWSRNCSGNECEITNKLIQKIVNFGISEKEIKIITPFRDVVKKIKGAGTIHTMQGKEARVIFLFLVGLVLGLGRGQLLSQIC